MSKRQNPPFFGFTSLTERSIGAGPPVIQLSGVNINKRNLPIGLAAIFIENVCCHNFEHALKLK